MNAQELLLPSPPCLADERAMSQARRRLARRERMARLVLTRAGWEASLEDLTASIRETWPNLQELEVTKVAMAAQALQATAPDRPRKLTASEWEEQVKMKEKVDAATRELLQSPTLGSREEVYQEVVRRTGSTMTYSSWETSVFYPVRKALGAEGVEPRTLPRKAYDPPPAVEIPPPEVKLRDDPSPAPRRNTLELRLGVNTARATETNADLWTLDVHLERVTTELLWDLLPRLIQGWRTGGPL